MSPTRQQQVAALEAEPRTPLFTDLAYLPGRQAGRQAGGTAPFPVPFRATSPPQVEATAVVAPRAGKQARKIVKALQMCGPMTMDEICKLTGIRLGSVCGRLSELENPDKYRVAFLAGSPAVRKAGTKLGTRGVHVTVYDLTESGRKL